MINTEHKEQVALIAWFDLQYRSLTGRLFAIPNGSNKSPAAANRFKAEGLRKGVPDLFLPVPAHGFHGLFIEMKRTKGGTLSKEQAEWLDFLTSQGYMAVICKGFDAAKLTIESYVGER